MSGVRLDSPYNVTRHGLVLQHLRSYGDDVVILHPAQVDKSTYQYRSRCVRRSRRGTYSNQLLVLLKSRRKKALELEELLGDLEQFPQYAQGGRYIVLRNWWNRYSGRTAHY